MLSLKTGDIVIAKRCLGFGSKHKGKVLDICDFRAWKCDIRWSDSKPFPHSDNGGSDLNNFRKQPDRIEAIKNELNCLILKGIINPFNQIPVLWNFNGKQKVYWENKNSLLKKLQKKGKRF